MCKDRTRPCTYYYTLVGIDGNITSENGYRAFRSDAATVAPSNIFVATTQKQFLSIFLLLEYDQMHGEYYIHHIIACVCVRANNDCIV